MTTSTLHDMTRIAALPAGPGVAAELHLEYTSVLPAPGASDLERREADAKTMATFIDRCRTALDRAATKLLG